MFIKPEPDRRLARESKGAGRRIAKRRSLTTAPTEKRRLARESKGAGRGIAKRRSLTTAPTEGT